MGIDKAVKKRVVEDWQNAFPQLTLYAQNKFYKVVGPCIFGIELIKSPHNERYSPYFVLYSLWGNRIGDDTRACMAGPFLLMDFKNKKGFQYEIPYEKHSMFFDEVVDSVKNQAPLLFEGNISFKQIEKLIEEYSKTPPLSAAPNSYLQAALQESKLKIALFVNSEEAKKIFEKINKRSWDLNHFKVWRVNISQWLQSLQDTIYNREEFIKQIEKNKQDKKISQLKTFELY